LALLLREERLVDLQQMTKNAVIRKKIGLLGPVTSGNLGNAALEAAAVQRLSKEFPDAEFHVCTRDSIEGLKEFGVRAFPFRRDTLIDKPAMAPSATEEKTSNATNFNPFYKRWLKQIPLLRSGVMALRSASGRGKNLAKEIRFLVSSYRFAKGFRYLIVCGGGQLDDVWDGPWGLPYSLFTWAVMAKLTGCPFLVVSVGAERVKTRLGRFFLRRALKIAKYRSYRDEPSRQIAEEIGVRGEQYVYPDLAFSLQIAGDPNVKSGAGERRVAGISPMAYCDPRVWPEKKAEKYTAHLGVLADFAERLVRDGWEIVVFASQNRMDKPVLEDFRKLLSEKMPNMANGKITFATTNNLKELLNVMRSVDQVAAARLHGVLLSLLSGIPAVALSYEMKVEALMRNMALTEYCLPIETTTALQLHERFESMAKQGESVRERIQQKAAEFRTALEDQYKRILRIRRE